MVSFDTVQTWADGWRPTCPCILIGADWSELPLDWGPEYAVARRRGSPQGAQTFRGQIAGPDAWDLDDDPAVAAEQVATSVDALMRARLPWCLTASQVAARISRRLELSPGPIPERFAPIMRSALHQGPQLVARGGAEVATEWDLREAYLGALDEPVPVPGSWRIARPSWPELADLEGVVTATVLVPPIFEVPPLPIIRGAETVWPDGIVTGTWPIHWVREAVALGCEVDSVAAAWTCSVRALLRPLHDRIKSIDDKRTRRAIYTRAWGRFAGLGHWRGVWHRLELPRRLRRVTRDRWAWRWERCEPSVADWPVDFRPDWSAWVASRTAIRVIRACATIPRGELVAAHIDALIVGGDWAPPEPDRWKVKRTGPIRAYAVGTWDHAGDVTAQGWQGKATSEGLREAAERGRMFAHGTRASRRWTSDPVYDSTATSEPPTIGYKPEEWSDDPS